MAYVIWAISHTRPRRTTPDRTESAVKKGIGQAHKVVIRGRALTCNEVDNEDQGGDTGSLKPLIGKCLLPEYDCSLAQD